jgi:membrane-bound lytic murein transglycosylase B
MRTRHTATALTAAALLALTACSADDSSTTAADTKPSAAPSEISDEERQKIGEEIGTPAEPTGAKRQELLDAIAEINPDAVRYEDKAIDASRNQCFAINGKGRKLDWTASQRFTYKDVTTTEAQGKQINAALKRIGFCDV